MVKAKVEMGFGQIKARMKDKSCGGGGWGRERSRSVESTTLQGRWDLGVLVSLEEEKQR